MQATHGCVGGVRVSNEHLGHSSAAASPDENAEQQGNSKLEEDIEKCTTSSTMVNWKKDGTHVRTP
jgi:hypothetical protein